MPRRHALTEAQLKALFALPTAEADLIRHWTLGSADLPAIERRCGGHNQLGYALQLCAFRHRCTLLDGEMAEITAETLPWHLGAYDAALARSILSPATSHSCCC